MAILLGSPNIVQKGIPERSLSQFGTPQSTPKPSYIFICQVGKFILFLFSSQAIWPPAQSQCWSWKSGQQRHANCSPIWCQTHARYRENKKIDVDNHNIIDDIKPSIHVQLPHPSKEIARRSFVQDGSPSPGIRLLWPKMMCWIGLQYVPFGKA